MVRTEGRGREPGRQGTVQIFQVDGTVSAEDGVGKIHRCVGIPQQSGMNVMNRVEGGMKVCCGPTIRVLEGHAKKFTFSFEGKWEPMLVFLRR